MHSNLSILDAISKIPDIVKRLKEYSHSSALLSDHGTIAGVPDFYFECKKVGIKPILGSEFYFIPDHEKHKQDIKDKVAAPGKRNYHLILMAQNAEGWKNIKILNTKANEKFYYDPRIDYKDLEQHSNGIIAMTACLKGIVPYNLSEDKFDEAAIHAKKMKDIFGDRFYLETQDGGLDIQIKINKAMRALGQQLDIKIVGAQDAHYIDRNDVEAHEAIWAIRTQDTLDKPVGDPKTGGRMYYSTREYWLKDAEHMLYEPLGTQKDGIYKGEKRPSTVTREELELTLEIADRIENVEIDTSMKLPAYEYIPDIRSAGCASAESKCGEHAHADNRAMSYLIELVRAGYEINYGKKFFDAPVEHKARLEKELKDIEAASLADYFLIVWDIISWTRKENIPVGPGRGSACGSMVAYCLQITEVEPLKYGLIWERFYNVGRIGSLADIDLDFSRNKRDKVIDYIKLRFGEKRVAQMVTFNGLKPKAALKDVNKLLGSEGMSFDEANIMTKYVHHKAKTLDQAINGSKDKDGNLDGGVPASEELQKYEKDNPKLFRLAKALEGSPKSRGKHAAGVIISKDDFDQGTISLCWDTKKKQLITEFDGVTVEKLGLLKLDALGLKVLDVLFDVQNDVNKRLD